MPNLSSCRVFRVLYLTVHAFHPSSVRRLLRYKRFPRLRPMRLASILYKVTIVLLANALLCHVLCRTVAVRGYRFLMPNLDLARPNSTVAHWLESFSCLSDVRHCELARDGSATVPSCCSIYLNRRHLMTAMTEGRMAQVLAARERKGLLRKLRVPSSHAVDFSSNDYLGIVRRRRLAPATALCASGATGSRLLSGQSEACERLEKRAATFHSAPSALLFNSGYDANVGFFSCVPQVQDFVVYDSLIHASVHDGMRLGRAAGSLQPFAHNSVGSLRRALLDVVKLAQGRRSGDEAAVCSVFVAVESVYSMDGDVAPLVAMLDLAQSMSTNSVSISLVVDEAHGVGVAGPHGEGVAHAQGVTAHPHLMARIVTFGKAFGAHGAMVLGSETLRSYLINYARSLIYSTVIPPHSVLVLDAAYDYMLTSDAAEARATLKLRRDAFRRLAAERLPGGSLLNAGAASPIQGIITPGNRECQAVSTMLQDAGFDVYPIRSPTVPKGSERIRIIIHAHNTAHEVERLVDALAKALREVHGATLPVDSDCRAKL